MKLCPVCQAQCFDDMETCFGCLYSFKQEQRRMHIPSIEQRAAHGRNARIANVPDQTSIGTSDQVRAVGSEIVVPNQLVQMTEDATLTIEIPRATLMYAETNKELFTCKIKMIASG